ncbi:hypothetical protein [Achromobacter sp. ESBL13]|uniref:hypothetical protein n=1 Tax=Achromobacter sp. ESBL13 TaxID=3077328 RepID=UPI002FCA7083
MTTTPYRDYLFGLIISIALAGWLAFLGLTAALTPDLGWGIVALLTAAIWVGGPLATGHPADHRLALLPFSRPRPGAGPGPCLVVLAYADRHADLPGQRIVRKIQARAL